MWPVNILRLMIPVLLPSPFTRQNLEGFGKEMDYELLPRFSS